MISRFLQKIIMLYKSFARDEQYILGPPPYLFRNTWDKKEPELEEADFDDLNVPKSGKDL